MAGAPTSSATDAALEPRPWPLSLQFPCGNGTPGSMRLDAPSKPVVGAPREVTGTARSAPVLRGLAPALLHAKREEDEGADMQDHLVIPLGVDRARRPG